MSNGFDKLKELGAQNIHEKTHITKAHVQAILHNSFDGMNKIQFLGFISILERDYAVDLSDLKIRGLEYFLNVNAEVEKNESVFVETKKSTNMTPYIIVLLFVIIIIAFFILNKTFFGESQEVTQKVDDTNIKNSLSQNTKPILEANSSTFEQNELKKIKQEDLNDSITVVEKKNLTEKKVQKKIKKEVAQAIKSFKIIPNKKLWMGYRDLKSNKYYQKIFLEELSLDPEKAWLMYLGHGNVKFEINGKILKFKSVRSMKFLYKDGELIKIDDKKYESIKKDRKW